LKKKYRMNRNHDDLFPTQFFNSIDIFSFVMRHNESQF
jgi:hypothetical protein